MTGQNAGFVGVGRMGGRMARRLLKAGTALTIYDTNDTAVHELQGLGATAASSPAAVGCACEIVFVCLPTPPIVESVVLGSNGVSEGSRVRIVVDMSTTGSAYARRIAEGYSALAGTNTSRLPLDCIAETMPARSMSSIRRAARL